MDKAVLIFTTYKPDGHKIEIQFKLFANDFGAL
jgi:hypothetical protein